MPDLMRHPNPRMNTEPSAATLIGRTVTVILTNAIPLYGVVCLGWNSVALIFLFVFEGIVVYFSDVLKYGSGRVRGTKPIILVFEAVFIFFFGFFALLVFGPYESLEAAVADRFGRIGLLLFRDLPRPAMGILIMRLVRLVHDLADSAVFGGRVRRKLMLDGGGWMFLLFFAVMCAPLVARSGPNPRGGLAAIVILKIMGETFAVWAVKIKSGGQ
jgi:hypothetical protein